MNTRNRAADQGKSDVYADADTWIYLRLSGWFDGAVPTWTFEVIHQAPAELIPGLSATSLPAIDMPADTIADGGLARFDASAGRLAVVIAFSPHY